MPYTIGTSCVCSLFQSLEARAHRTPQHLEHPFRSQVTQVIYDIEKTLCKTATMGPISLTIRFYDQVSPRPGLFIHPVNALPHAI